MPSRQCQTCYHQFSSDIDLSTHIADYEAQAKGLLKESIQCRIHEPKQPELKLPEPQKCQHCGEVFQTHEMLQDHIEDFVVSLIPNWPPSPLIAVQLRETLIEMMLLGRFSRCRLHLDPAVVRYAHHTDSDKCPVIGCHTQDSKNLKRHFQEHLECFVICPDRCRQTFRFASSYLRHNCLQTNKYSSVRGPSEHARRLKVAVTQWVGREFDLATQPYKKKRKPTDSMDDRRGKRHVHPDSRHVESTLDDGTRATNGSESGCINEPVDSIPLHNDNDPVGSHPHTDFINEIQTVPFLDDNNLNGSGRMWFMNETQMVPLLDDNNLHSPGRMFFMNDASLQFANNCSDN